MISCAQRGGKAQRAASQSPKHIPNAEAGATLIEFALVLVFGLLPMVLAILQIAALLVARNTVNLATFLAARQGAVTQASGEAMRLELARGLLPLYVRAASSGRPSAASIAQAYAAALVDVRSLDSLLITSPTRVAAERLALARKGVHVIPNDSIEFRPPAIQAANVLTIGVIHCQPLVVPLVGPALASALALIDAEPQHQRCYGLGRAPLRARASVAMQSDLPLSALR